MLDPEVVIADEPTTALDMTVQAQITELLADLRRESGMAMILISHDLAVVSQTTDRVAVMYGGKMLEAGSAADVLARARHPYTAALLRAIPTIDGPRRRLAAIPGTVAAQMSVPGSCVFATRCADVRPECTQARPPSQGDARHWARCVLDGPGKIAATSAARLSEPGPETATADLMIEALGVSKLYHMKAGLFGARKEIRALDDVSLSVRRGETVALVGESGSGKSMLARILLGLVEPTAATARLQGRPIAGMADAARAVGAADFSRPQFLAQPTADRGRDHRPPVGPARRERGQADGPRTRDDGGRAPAHAAPAQLSRASVGWAAPARGDRAGHGQPPRGADLRRADIGAGRLGAGADPEPAVGSSKGVRADHADHHPWHGGRAPLANRVAVLLQGRLVEEESATQVLARPRADYTWTLLAAAPRFGPAALAGTHVA